MGDALSCFRPHAGSSTNQAALSPLLLDKVMGQEMTIEEWEIEVLGYAKVTGLFSVALGNKNQFGFTAFLVGLFWFGQAWIGQWVRKYGYASTGTVQQTVHCSPLLKHPH